MEAWVAILIRVYRAINSFSPPGHIVGVQRCKNKLGTRIKEVRDSERNKKATIKQRFYCGLSGGFRGPMMSRRLRRPSRNYPLGPQGAAVNFIILELHPDIDSRSSRFHTEGPRISYSLEGNLDRYTFKHEPRV
jgi:hypothetical protein